MSVVSQYIQVYVDRNYYLRVAAGGRIVTASGLPVDVNLSLSAEGKAMDRAFLLYKGGNRAEIYREVWVMTSTRGATTFDGNAQWEKLPLGGASVRELTLSSPAQLPAVLAAQTTLWWAAAGSAQLTAWMVANSAEFAKIAARG